MTQGIFNQKNGHFVRSNKVALKYIDFKKDVDPDVHVRVFNSMVKANIETFEEYIINAFSYTLRDMASNWCHNYISKFLDYIFSELQMHFANIIGRLKMTSKYT
jgi:hypothetical protein